MEPPIARHTALHGPRAENQNARPLLPRAGMAPKKGRGFSVARKGNPDRRKKPVQSSSNRLTPTCGYTTPSASPASQRPQRVSGEAGRPSPGSAAAMEPPPPPKRRTSSSRGQVAQLHGAGGKQAACDNAAGARTEQRVVRQRCTRSPAQGATRAQGCTWSQTTAADGAIGSH